ncbi:hypothetical protein V8F33_009121 [Rhypophila sp. PSN 637]
MSSVQRAHIMKRALCSNICLALGGLDLWTVTFHGYRSSSPPLVIDMAVTHCTTPVISRVASVPLAENKSLLEKLLVSICSLFGVVYTLPALLSPSLTLIRLIMPDVEIQCILGLLALLLCFRPRHAGAASNGRHYISLVAFLGSACLDQLEACLEYKSRLRRRDVKRKLPASHTLDGIFSPVVVPFHKGKYMDGSVFYSMARASSSLSLSRL